VEDANRNGARDAGETSARLRDSDEDGYGDGVEALLLSSDPLDAASPGTAIVDADGDGLPASHDPDDENADADGDRIQDGYEAVHGGMAFVTDADQNPVLGDVDSNGVRDNADAQFILNFFASQPVDLRHPAADLNRDAVIDNSDAQHALVFFSWGIEHLPVGN
jgi:hypothetical protein